MSPSNAPYPTGYMEFLVNNEGASWKEKELIQLTANFNTLASGESVTTRYLLEDATTWTNNLDSTSTGDVVLKQMISNSRFHLSQVAVDLATTGSTSPTVQSVMVVNNLLESESVYG